MPFSKKIHFNIPDLNNNINRIINSDINDKLSTLSTKINKKAKKLKYIHITKCGGTFIDALGNEQNISWGKSDKEYGFWHEIFINKTNELKEKYDWFMIVRNPYDRIISEYYSKEARYCKGQKCDFHDLVNFNHVNKEEFNNYLIDKINNRSLTGDHYTEQYKYIENIDDNKNINVNIIKFENMYKELSNLFKKYKIDIDLTNKVPPSSKKRNPYNLTDFNKTLINLINKVYYKDFILFNYPIIPSIKDINNPFNIYGKINPNVEFYIVYSTSACPYQDWQCELLEASIKNSSDASRCQIIKLLSYDSKHKSDNFLLSDDVTFLFPEANDRLGDNTHLALLNKPNCFISFTEYWLQNKELGNDALFILLDPDMVWYKKLDSKIFPEIGTMSGHQWSGDRHIMFPLICRALDLNKISYKYLEYSHSLYPKHGYHCEMYAFTQSVEENNIKETILTDFGLDCRCRNSDAYQNTYFLHYCQLFKEDDKKLWFKQDYTKDTKIKPWKRPYNYHNAKEISYQYVLQLIDKLIRSQETDNYIVPRIIKRPTNRLEIYLWGISDDEQYIMENCKYCLQTAHKFGLKPKILGLNYDWESKTGKCKFARVNSRIYLIKDLLDKFDDNDDTVFLIMDGFDTLFNGDPSEILENFYRYNTDLLMSAEKNYTYQWANYKHFFNNNELDSTYKYINAGTLIGYKSAIKRMIDNCINQFEKCVIKSKFDCGNDQAFMGKYIAENIKNKNQNRLDINCDLFWVTTKDNNILNKVLNNNELYNQNTNTHPAILHIIEGRRNLEPLYLKAFNKIMEKI